MKRILASALTIATSLALTTQARAVSENAIEPDPTLLWAPCSVSTEIRAARTQVATSGGVTPSPSPSAQPAIGGANPRVTIANGGVINQTNIGAQAIEQSAQTGTYEAVKSVPGVIDTNTRASSGADSLQIRGIKLDNSSNYRMEGALTMNNQINLPLEDKCRIQALKGAGALQFGIASPAGIINYILKRATLNPVYSVGFSGNAYGQAIGSLDMGERFGDQRQFGLRMVLASGEMGSVAQGAFGTRYVGALTGDWYIGKRMTVQFDFEQLGINLIEQSALILNKAVNNVILLPNAQKIDPRNLLSGAWAWSRGWEQNVVGRFGYALSNNTSFVFENGFSIADRPYRYVSQIGSYNVFTGAGTASVTFVQNQEYTNDFYDAFVQSHAGDDRLSNDLALGFNFNQRYVNDPSNPKGTYKQNIYDPVVVAAPPTGNVNGREFLPEFSHDSDPYISDTVSINNRIQVLGGIRDILYYENDAVTQTTNKISNSTTLAPAAGIVYDIRPNVTAYASYVQSLEQTGQAPASAANAYQVLPPEKANQKEVGIRANDVGSFSGTLAYFRISQGNATTDPVTNIYNLNGTITYEGLESTNTLRLNSKLDFEASGIWMRGVQVASDPSINGLPPENMPHLSYRLGVGWHFVPSWTFHVGSSFFSWREANPQNQAILPNIGLAQMGVSYYKVVGNRPLQFNIECTNLFNLRYLSSVTSGNLGVGAPRNVTVNLGMGI